MKVRPWLPSDAQDISEPGPPERSGSSVGSTSGWVSSLIARKCLSATANRPVEHDPLAGRRPAAGPAARPGRGRWTPGPTGRAAGRAVRRRRSSRTRPTRPRGDRAATSRTTGKPNRAGGSTPISSWMSRLPARSRGRGTPPTADGGHAGQPPPGRPGGLRQLPGWSAARTSQTASTPRPYPMAARIPLITPWRTDRGAAATASATGRTNVWRRPARRSRSVGCCAGAVASAATVVPERRSSSW